MRRSLFFAVPALLLCTLDAAAQDRFSLTGDRVAVYNIAGEVRVEPGSDANVVVEMTRGGSGGHQLQVDRRSEDGWQLLVVKYPDDRIVYRRSGITGRFSRSEFSVNRDGIFGARNLDPDLGAERTRHDVGSSRGGGRVRVSGSGSGLEAHADLRVLVPAGRTVSIHLGVGKVIATNINGDVQIDARSASIEASNIAGLGRFDTGSGSIIVRGARGDLGLHTGSGSIRVDDVHNGVFIAHTGSGSVEASNLNVSEMEINTGSGGVTVHTAEAPATRVVTGSGGIRVNRLGARNFDLHTGSGSVRIALTSDVQVGRIETGSGGIDVALPQDAGAEIVIDTGSGGINVDVPSLSISESRRSYLRGSIGDGNGTLRVSTGSGGVSFRSL